MLCEGGRFVLRADGVRGQGDRFVLRAGVCEGQDVYTDQSREYTTNKSV